ncbi:Ferredoxin subunit of nitrite reductase or a ring-hydroxylating dioxygenase [Mariprofundus aestuarium]|uniref:Ferredoxin subunit of nitrite reductase or a ring-hydroxylating dioxygenase n=1 Tax=Mariprofundus aestuarium TaxID=1921086 RepID=A0A2K8KVQ8_MARES|nr:Ferredoxin subunit of nitrite reductase or a ring-hydroxylating dioxygenase [Mariprofundus aestuarium]
MLATTDGWSPIFYVRFFILTVYPEDVLLTDQLAWQEVNKPAEGEAVCFNLKARVPLSNGQYADLIEQGFLICYQGQFRAWRNRCPHAGAPLDWVPGQFFSENGEQLVCHVHHAHFQPLTGECLSGPCTRGLFPLNFREDGDKIVVPVAADDSGCE